MTVKHDGKPLEAVQVIKNPENVSVRVIKTQNGASIENENSVQFIGQNLTTSKLPVNGVNNEKIITNVKNLWPFEEIEIVEIEGPSGSNLKSTIEAEKNKLDVKNTQDFTTVEHKNTVKSVNNEENDLNDKLCSYIHKMNGRVISELDKFPQTSTPSFETIPKINPTDQSLTGE